ncbi:MAG: tetratricopeptide repeat protein [Patescibacteria group bacterium]
MFNLFPQLIILLSLVAIIVIFIRRIPKLKEVKIEEKPKEKTTHPFFYKLFNIFKKLLTILKDFSLNIFRRLYQSAKEIKEKKETKLKAEKEVKELVTTLLPAEKTKAVFYDEISLFEKAAKFFGSGNFSEAEKTYIEIIKKDPKNVRAYKGLGQIYLKQRNFKDAKAAFEEVLKIDPQDQEIKTELKVIESKMPTTS